ncbi:MAG: sigma-70 family RNA polymerase sigma factor [Candidatus Thiodiazotropha endolucinida]|uniref:ECF RNA polymerase sigma factor SigK n=1 Tax=Candidatus Thiodiazotropha endolucinida TaxID=1655433 RepID=A0A7Z0VKC7_9GAMM|nr:sigma-70 family RNA polymerase sigma factor [Candidatus Thiodiazotropha endolucinida]ODJ87247.1 ECF RNA polymerase sigma factor SigK [Candidatus Thiodiazotropha endolucinida]
MSSVNEKHPKYNNQRNQELKELLAACALNDRSAFARLYQLTSPKLYGVVLHILNREATAQECLQDTYIKIWNNAESYRTHLAAPMTWMTTIARNQALDHLRRCQREVMESDGYSFIEQIDTQPLPLEFCSHSKEKTQLMACLDQLNENQRQMISLAYFRGLTHSELASRTNTPIGTVKTQIRRGLEQLRGCLET